MNNIINVLLVDDEDKFRLNMMRLLSFRGFSVAGACDGLEALKILEIRPFDVVILDIKMPKMDGITVLEKIKKMAPETEVIMLTGHGAVDSGIQAMRMGAFDYLLKPCDIEDLTEKIREARELERIRRRPVLWPRSRIKEIVWPLFANLYTHDPLRRALEVFIRRPGMPDKEVLYVVDEQDRFKGVVSRRDLVKAAADFHGGVTWEDLLKNPDLLPPFPISRVMRQEPVRSTDPEERLDTAAQRMIESSLRCMPVMEKDRLKGVIRLQDIFKYIGHQSRFVSDKKADGQTKPAGAPKQNMG